MGVGLRAALHQPSQRRASQRLRAALASAVCSCSCGGHPSWGRKTPPGEPLAGEGWAVGCGLIEAHARRANGVAALLPQRCGRPDCCNPSLYQLLTALCPAFPGRTTRCAQQCATLRMMGPVPPTSVHLSGALAAGRPATAWGCGAACSWEPRPATTHTHHTPLYFLLVPGSQGGRRVPAAADVQRKLPREAAAGALLGCAARRPSFVAPPGRALGRRRPAGGPAVHSAAGSMHGVRIWMAPYAQAASAPGLKREDDEVPCGLTSACLRARRPAGAVHDRDVPPQRVH